MPSVGRSLVSEADFLALPESMTKIELLDGEVIVSPSPEWWHQEVLLRLFMALRSWAETQPDPVTVAAAPCDIRFAPGRILQPDAFVHFGAIDRATKGPLDIVPALCVEVLSTNRLYDRVTKRFVYAAAGVAEMWAVEPAGLVERWSGPDRGLAEEVRGRLTSPLLPGFVLDIDALFA